MATVLTFCVVWLLLGVLAMLLSTRLQPLHDWMPAFAVVLGPIALLAVVLDTWDSFSTVYNWRRRYAAKHARKWKED